MRLLSPTTLLLFLSLTAMAEEIPSAPGWSLSRISEETQEENVYSDTRVYFSLKPPDSRPAISVDAGTADRLRSGDANAEGVYGGRQAAKKDDEEFVYGNHGNGIQMADPVNSTLTADEGRKDPPLTQAASNTRNLSNQGGGLSGANAGGGISSDAGRATAAKALAMQGGLNSSTGASSPLTAAAAAASASASGGGSLSADPRQIAAANMPIPGNSTQHGSLAANNVASGFGIDTSTSSSTSTSFSVWPDGDPSTKTGTSSAVASCNNSRLTFNSATLQRFSVPDGCVGVKIDVFGAGGGMGTGVSANGLRSYSADGGGAAYVHTEGLVDGGTYDMVVVVGSPGGDAKGTVPGEAGFLGGGAGGEGGGGGGGYSGLFLANKAQFNHGETPQLPNFALAVAGGGGGGSAMGVTGGEGGVDTGGGPLGGSQTRGGAAQGAGKAGQPLRGGAAGSMGGGGGGGLYGGGGGGGSGNTDSAPAMGGGGGSSYFVFKNSSSSATAGSGTSAGNASFSNRNEAGNAGKAGLVIVTFY